MYLTVMRTESADSYIHHQEVTRMFPKETGRALFTYDSRGILRVLSSVEREGPTIIQCKKVERPAVGDVIPFKVKFNPTKNVRTEKGGKSKCTGILEEGEAIAWLTKELEGKFGVSVQAVASTFQGTKRILKNGKVHAIVVQHVGVGVVTILDSEKFATALQTGVGGTKFAGYGLLDLWYAA